MDDEIKRAIELFETAPDLDGVETLDLTPLAVVGLSAPFVAPLTGSKATTPRVLSRHQTELKLKAGAP